MRTVLVTGATRGLGREIAHQLLVRGERVIVSGRRPDDVRTAVHELGGDAIALVLDVSDAASVAAAGEQLTDQVGTLDVLVNNAAIHYDTDQLAVTADLGIVEEALATNLLGPWRLVHAVLPLLKQSAHPRIVNVSSEGGSISQMTGGTPAYSVSKAGLNALTRLLAGELRSHGVLVNAVCPGWVATEMGGRGGDPVDVGARRVIWAVDLPDDGPTGGFSRAGVVLPW